MPIAGSKRNAVDSGDDDHQAKKRRTIAPVIMADGNRPLKATWEMTELKDRKGLLPKFRVSPLSCAPPNVYYLPLKSIIRLATDKRLERLVNWEDQGFKSKERAKKMVSRT